jgi:hypothetical protein
MSIKSLQSAVTDNTTRDTVMISASSKTTIGGTVTSVFGWLSSTDVAVFIGVVITVLGFLVNFYFARLKTKREIALLMAQEKAQLRSEEREEELHRARLQGIYCGNEDSTK